MPMFIGTAAADAGSSDDSLTNYPLAPVLANVLLYNLRQRSHLEGKVRTAVTSTIADRVRTGSSGSTKMPATFEGDKSQLAFALRESHPALEYQTLILRPFSASRKGDEEV